MFPQKTRTLNVVTALPNLALGLEAHGIRTSARVVSNSPWLLRFITYGLLILLSVGCTQSQSSPHVMRGETMGTTYTIKLTALPGEATLSELQSEVDQTLVRINQLMSTYLTDSELSRLNRHPNSDWFDVSPETAQVSSVALRLNRDTGGAFDPTISPLVDLWNFGPEPAAQRIPTPAEIAQTMESVGPDLLEVQVSPPAIRKRKPSAQLDLSGIAKGYAVDRLAELLKHRGVEAFMIEVGGEVRVQGQRGPDRGWIIGIEAPDDQRRSLAKAVRLEDRSLATSGDYRNFFVKDNVRYSHLIDPKTGSPIAHRLKSVSVIHSSCMEADALATALIVMGPDEGYQFAVEHDLAALFFVTDDDEITQRMTPTFEEHLASEGKPS